MDYCALGRTSIKVSRLCLGTMTFGEQNSEAEGHAQMDYALERGINFFDAAEIYPIPPKPETQGRTEAIIGTWLAARKTRDKGVIATKVAGRGKMVWMAIAFAASRPFATSTIICATTMDSSRPISQQPSSSCRMPCLRLSSKCILTIPTRVPDALYLA